MHSITMSRVICLGFLATALSGCDRAPNVPIAAPAGGTDELKWARPVAEDFLTALKQGNREVGANLITKGFESRLRDGNPKTSLPVLLGSVWTGDLIKTYGGESECYQQIASYEIRADALAPDRKEATFDGVLKMKDGKEFKFRIRVVPENEGGKWRVDSILIS